MAEGPIFLVAEIEVFASGEVTTLEAEPFGVLALGTLSKDSVPLEDTSTMLVSDHGYVTRNDDPDGVQVYEPILSSGIEIDRRLELNPDGQGAAAGWGSIRLINNDSALTGLVASRNCDGRDLVIRRGRKIDSGYKTWRDPPKGTLEILLAGVGAGWTLTDQEVTVVLRDPSYWLEQVIEGSTYGGTGGLDGNSTLKDTRKPLVRGGTNVAPVQEVAPILVDPTLGIYQVSDAYGTVEALYERGLAGGITFNANVADITLGSPPAATYDVESSGRGLFIRLGTFPPAGRITVDCTGKFPDNTAASTAGALTKKFLQQDMSLPTAYLDTASFDALDTAFAFPVGFHIPPGDQLDARLIVGTILRSSAARLVPTREGKLACIRFIPVDPVAVSVAKLNTANVISVEQVPLSAPLMPPPQHISVGWGRHYTVQTTGLAPTLSGIRLQELAQAWQVATNSGSGDVTLAWRRPSNPAIVETVLTSQAGGEELAALLAELWCIQEGRKVYNVTVPLSIGLEFDLGEVVSVRYPGALVDGKLGMVVGEQIRTEGDVAILQVLV